MILSPAVILTLMAGSCSGLFKMRWLLQDLAWFDVTIIVRCLFLVRLCKIDYMWGVLTTCQVSSSIIILTNFFRKTFSLCAVLPSLVLLLVFEESPKIRSATSNVWMRRSKSVFTFLAARSDLNGVPSDPSLKWFTSRPVVPCRLNWGGSSVAKSLEHLSCYPNKTIHRWDKLNSGENYQTLQQIH